MERGSMRSPDANEILRNGGAANLRTAIDNGAEDPRDRTPPPIIPRPALLSKAQFLADYVPPDWLVDGILQRRFIYSLTAKTGDGKTAVALLIAQLVAALDRRDVTLGRRLDPNECRAVENQMRQEGKIQ
jgi:hypothetical protein